jgi:hypothetical protein
MKHSISARCHCGAFTLRAEGPPIVTTACYCTSCQAAAGALPSGESGSLLEADGGTLCTLFRKDRVHWASNALREHRLTPTSKTRRVVATCCNTPMFMEFTNGHWLSLYTRRFAPADQPPLEMRVMTRDAPNGPRFADGVPSYRTHSFAFFVRLFWAWACMGFRAPTFDIARSTHDAV